MCTRILPQKDTYVKTDLYGLSLKCDWFIHKTDIINITDTKSPKYIYLLNRMGYITIPFFVNTVLPSIIDPIVVIIAGDDFTFPMGDKDDRDNFYHDIQHIVNILINSTIITKIYVENLDTLHTKLVPIPLGILNHNKQLYKNIKIPKLSTRKIQVFCAHQVREGTQWKNRKIVKDLCITKWENIVYFQDSLTEIEFKHFLLNSKFCICVNGGGIDPSPKVWQALLCGCIPIIQRSSLDEAYSRFPVIYIDEWVDDCITQEKINIWFDQTTIEIEQKKIANMLTLNYWWNIISSNL